MMNKQIALPIYKDIHLIALMVVYLGHTDRTPRKINPTDEKLLGKPENKVHRYRCKHFDPKTRDCTIYEIRPQMCRDYPGDKGCNFHGCTASCRQKPWTKKQTEKYLRELKLKKQGLELKEPDRK